MPRETHAGDVEMRGIKFPLVVGYRALSFFSSSSPATPPSLSLSSQAVLQAAADTSKQRGLTAHPASPQRRPESSHVEWHIVSVFRPINPRPRLTSRRLCLFTQRSLRNQLSAAVFHNGELQGVPANPTSSPALVLENGIAVAQKPSLLFVRISHCSRHNLCALLLPSSCSRTAL